VKVYKIAERAIGCEICGKPVAMAGDKIVTTVCMWCVAEYAPMAAMRYADEAPSRRELERRRNRMLDDQQLKVNL
jgi:ribosome-binding protein aMBF1 (putative translation factor)